MISSLERRLKPRVACPCLHVHMLKRPMYHHQTDVSRRFSPAWPSFSTITVEQDLMSRDCGACFFSFDQELCYLFYYLKLSQPGNQTLWKRQSTNGGAIAFKCFFSFKAVFRCYKYINSEDGKHKCLIIVDYNFNNICIHVILMLDNIIKRIILSEMTKPWVW